MAGEARAAAAAADRLTQAHRALVDDGAIQFRLRPADPPPAPPAWLRALGHWLAERLAPVGRFLNWIGGLMPDAPYARILLWTMIVLVLAAMLWAAWQRIRHGEWRLPRRRRRGGQAVEIGDEAWAPGEAPVHAWLREADALAAEGRYAEAVHHLLFRAIEDIGRRRPQLIRPALTSRELGAAGAVPPSVRVLFVSIARLVERSLFGGRPVAADDWTQARAAYADLALPKVWRG